MTNYVFNISGVKANVWIGVKRKESSNQFVWDDGSIFDFTNWTKGSPSEEVGKDCVEMQSMFTREFSNISNLNLRSINGEWKDVSCESENIILCQKLQTLSFPQLQKSFLEVRKELSDARNQLSDTKNELRYIQHELNDTRHEISDIRHELNDTRLELNDTRHEMSDIRHELNDTRLELNDTRHEISDIKRELNDTRHEMSDIQHELNDTRLELNDTRHEMSNIRHELNDIRHELGRMINERLNGIEGAFNTTFEVGGSVDYYYPVAFEVHKEDYFLRTALMYDIYRGYYETPAPESINKPYDGINHYMGLTLKVMCSDGGWDAGANVVKVLLHKYAYNKGVAKVQLYPDTQEFRLFVWLRGGGIIYHIRSPIDLTNKITIFLENNAVASPTWCHNGNCTEPIIVNPVAVGNEDPNLVKPGAYDGWGF